MFSTIAPCTPAWSNDQSVKPVTARTLTQDSSWASKTKENLSFDQQVFFICIAVEKLIKKYQEKVNDYGLDDELRAVYKQVLNDLMALEV
jgi:hypothetical protein